MKRLLAHIGLALTMMVSMLTIPSAIVSAHGGKCTVDDAVKITVWDDAGQTGTKDSLCVFNAAQSPPSLDDDDFRTNDIPWPFKDVGEQNNMHDKVSSYSFVNRENIAYTVCIYQDENQGGALIKERILYPDAHLHLEQGWFYNDDADSIRLYEGQANCP